METRSKKVLMLLVWGSPLPVAGVLMYTWPAALAGVGMFLLGSLARKSKSHENFVGMLFWLSAVASCCWLYYRCDPHSVISVLSTGAACVGVVFISSLSALRKRRLSELGFILVGICALAGFCWNLLPFHL